MANPFATAVALQRATQPQAPAHLRRMGSYAGAATNPLTARDWIFATLRSANQDVRGNHRRLTDRARDLSRNDPYGRRFLSLVTQNIVGPHGIQLQPQVRDPDGSFNEELNREISAAWKRWGDPSTCSVDGRHSWVEVQQLMARGWARDGEALLRLVPGFDNEFGFAVQHIDPDQLDIEFNQPAGNGRNEIRMGIEINGWGRPVAYWLWTSHPTETQGAPRQRIRVPADQIVFLALTERAGQLRAVTWYAPILVTARMLQGYREAELTTARISSSKSVFFKQTDPDGFNYADAPEDEPFVMEATPGQYEVLPPGLEPHFWNPDHPSTAYESFEKQMLRGISTGFGVTYAGLTGDLSDTSYSSMREGKLSERDTWMMLQGIFSTQVNAVVYRHWLKWAITSGAVRAPLRPGIDLFAHRWLARGWPWVDPEKDINSGLTGVAGGIDTLTRLAAEQGRTLEEVLRERKREIALADELGVPIALPSPKGAAAPVPPASQES